MKVFCKSHSKAVLVLSLLIATIGLHACSDDQSAAASKGKGAKVIGNIEGTIGDNAGPWEAIEIVRGSDVISTATWREVMKGLVDYSIQGHEGARFAVANSVGIDMQLWGQQRMSTDVVWFPESGLSPNYSAVDGSVTVNFDSVEPLEASGDTLRVIGTAQGKIYLHQGPNTPPDMNDSLDVNLRFETEMRKQE